MISLITATLGRTDEVRTLLESLSTQIYKDFELILVDQNSHRDLEMMVTYFKSINIVYMRSDVKGLSNNRNVGLRCCQGDIIGFPDDDCYYDANLLQEVVNAFEETQSTLIAVNAKGSDTNNTFLEGDNLTLNRKDLFYKCISYNFFIKRVDGMEFDTQLGVGSNFGSGEETDFLWNNIGRKDVCRMIGSTFVHHPENIGAVNPERAYKYGLGFGAIMKKEVIYRHNYSMLSIYISGLIRAFGGLVLKRGRNSYYKSLLGRLRGFITYKSV